MTSIQQSSVKHNGIGARDREQRKDLSGVVHAKNDTI
jgi:hypothetical protein